MTRFIIDRLMRIRLKRTPIDWVWELTPNELEECKNELAAVEKSGNWAFGLTFVPAFVLLYFVSYWVIVINETWMPDAVWDTRSRDQGFGMLVAASGFAMALSAFVSRFYLRMRWGDRLRLLDGYSAVTKRKDPAFLAILCSVVGLVWGLVGIPIMWLAGERIDQSGIRFAPAAFRIQSFEYTDVRTVGLYQAHHARVGVVHRLNLQVTFKDGEVLQIFDNKKARDAAKIARTAEYVADKSGVPLVRAEVRPK